MSFTSFVAVKTTLAPTQLEGFGDHSTEPPRSSGHDGGPPVEAELAQRIRCCVLRRSWVLPCLRPNSGGPSRHRAMSLSQTESS